MLDRFMKHMKRYIAILLTLAILMTTGVAAYAVINYITTGPQTSVFTRKEYFEMESLQFFSAASEVGPGVKVSINPVITSKASVDMNVFIRFEMPMYRDGGLYELTPDSSCSLIESGEVHGKDDRWYEVYCYNEPLTLGASTTAVASSLTTVDMGMDEYAEIEDINVSMTGYAYKTDVDVDDAWESIKSEAGL